MFGILAVARRRLSHEGTYNEGCRFPFHVEDDAPVATLAIPDLRLDDLVAFLTIARSASMSAAARELRVTPSKLARSSS